MDFEIFKIDRWTCNLNKIYFRRFIRETLSTNIKGWLSKADLARMLKLDSVEILQELIDSKLDIIEGLSKFVNGEDILHLIDDLQFPNQIRKGDTLTLFEFLQNPNHTWEDIEVNIWRVVNSSRMLKCTNEKEEYYVGADNILRCLGLYDVLFESKRHDILKKLADKVKNSSNKFSRDYDKLIKKMRMTLMHALYNVLGSIRLMKDFLNSISSIICRNDTGFDDMINEYSDLRGLYDENFDMKSTKKIYDITKQIVGDQTIEECKLTDNDEDRNYISNKKDKMMFKKIVAFKISEWLKDRYKSIVELDRATDEYEY